uniref:Kinetochore protein SPC25 n=1 Tax=Globisporangium ultimum (strain ATCC 200006 / CBS 805.95 / DAOM BR144) TaxID=431595 RepID=K3W6J4_GLOUD
MISKLKQEVSTLSSRLQDDQIKREKEIEKLQTENKLRAVEDNLQLAQANKLLEIYRLVTSTEIQLIETLEDDDEPSCTDVSCTTIDSATGKHFQFELGVPEDEHEEIEYLPGDAPSKDIKIPSYLQDELSFKRPEMTKFMRTILDVVIRKNAKSSR